LTGGVDENYEKWCQDNRCSAKIQQQYFIIKKGRACGMYVREEEYLYGFGGKARRKVWDVNIRGDNHVHYNKSLSFLEYHSHSG
jgi:hypothetical protein